MTRLSLLIPARNEMWLARTVADALAHIQGDTDIWVALDGPSDHAPVPVDPRVHVLALEAPIGQRAASNRLARATDAEFVMKVDAHCAFDDGFDEKLLADMQPDWTLVPVMRNLHVFNWRCSSGHERYQSPSGPCSDYYMCAGGHQRPGADSGKCPECGLPCVRHDGCGAPTAMRVTWLPKSNPSSRSYRFDSEPHFQYFGEWSRREAGKGELTETMSLQGSCFLVARARWLDLDLCDESWGSWGSQGIEVAAKSWLSGGRVMCSHKTWYAHMFRTQGGDFSFPYSMSGDQQDYAKARAREVFFENRWPRQVRPLSWLIDHFAPVPGWHLPDKTTSQPKADLMLAQIRAVGRVWEAGHVAPALERRGLIYYTDGLLSRAIAEPVRARLARIASEKGLPIVTAALGRKLSLGAKNIVFPSLKRGHLTMFKQILAALIHTNTEVVFFTEHDVLYHPSHFEFVPPRADTYYYNTNVWQLRLYDGHCLYYFHRSLSQMVCHRALAITHYQAKIARLEAAGGHYEAKLGFEPGTRGVRAGGVDDSPCGDFRSAVPNIDLRHDGNLTRSRWTLAEFRTPVSDWQESDSVPGWGAGRDLLTREAS